MAGSFAGHFAESIKTNSVEENNMSQWFQCVLGQKSFGQRSGCKRLWEKLETENACCETEPTEAVKTGEVHRVAKRPRGQFIMVYPGYAVYPQPHMCCLLIKRCFQTSERGSKLGKQWIYKVIFKSLSSLRCLKRIKMCKMQTIHSGVQFWPRIFQRRAPGGGGSWTATAAWRLRAQFKNVE